MNQETKEKEKDPARGDGNNEQGEENISTTEPSSESDTEDEEGFVDQYNNGDPYDLEGFIIGDDLDNLDEAVIQHLFDRQDHEDQRREMELEHERLLRQEEEQRRELQGVQASLEHWQRLVQEKTQERDEWHQRRDQQIRGNEDYSEP